MRILSRFDDPAASHPTAISLGHWPKTKPHTSLPPCPHIPLLYVFVYVQLWRAVRGRRITTRVRRRWSCCRLMQICCVGDSVCVCLHAVAQGRLGHQHRGLGLSLATHVHSSTLRMPEPTAPDLPACRRMRDLCSLIKALWLSGADDDCQLARALVSKVCVVVEEGVHGASTIHV